MKIKINLNEKQLEIIAETGFETSFLWETLSNIELKCWIEHNLSGNEPVKLIIKDTNDV